MKIPRIINSLLSTDMYKYSMGQTIYHQFPEYTTTWQFRCRNTDVKFTPEMVEEIRSQIREYCNLRFTEDELEYLAAIPWMKKSYINFLRLWHPRFEDFKIDATTDGCGLSIETEGTWLNTSMYEIPTLAIVNEVYFKMQYNYKELLAEFKRQADQKVQDLVDGKYNIGVFSEFGIRRRLSDEAQEYIIDLLKERNGEFKDSHFVGTSNVYLARDFEVTPVGTMAHEFATCCGEGNHKLNPAYANHYAMEAWVKEYKTQNGIYLTDLLGTDVFLRDFDLTYATLFSGVRHDSGDPIAWGEKILAHYRNLKIDPKTKTLLFSDTLDFEKASKIYEHFKDKAKVAFGIGTYLAGCPAFGDVHPLNIVMKVVKCNDSPVAKISDAPGKILTISDEYVDYLKRAIAWRLEKTND